MAYYWLYHLGTQNDWPCLRNWCTVRTLLTLQNKELFMTVLHFRYMFGEEGYCLTSFQTAINFLVSEGLQLPVDWPTVTWCVCDIRAACVAMCHIANCVRTEKAWGTLLHCLCYTYSHVIVLEIIIRVTTKRRHEVLEEKCNNLTLNLE